MTDKKTFGEFIKAKRIEKNYSQRELADLLFVTEGAISKWERGVSYPDITLISDICRTLDISEHEFVTATTDTRTRGIERDARKFQKISRLWFWIPTIFYAVALLTCFICNLAVNHKLSWFYIVLSSLVCAYTFLPTITSFFEKNKVLAFSASTYLSICGVLLTCAIYTGGMSWLGIACVGTLLGYDLLFVPILLSRTKLSRYKFLISFASAMALTILLLMSIHIWYPFMLGASILLTCYGYLLAILCTFICTFRLDGFLKAGICTLLSVVGYYFTGHLVNFLFGINGNHYEVDFHNWAQCTTGNVHFICLTSIAVIGLFFIEIGVIRITKKGYGDKDNG